MTLTDFLLIVVVILLAVRIWQSERNRDLNTELFAAFATMMGEWFGMWRERDGKD